MAEYASRRCNRFEQDNRGMIRQKSYASASGFSAIKDSGHEWPSKAPALKPKLLIVELWGLADLVIATPFLRRGGGTV